MFDATTCMPSQFVPPVCTARATADTPAFGMLDDAESGVNPEALAHVVKELRRESAALQQAEIEAEANRSL